MTRRAHIGLKTKLASALCQIKYPDADGDLWPVIPYEQQKTMTEDEILAVFQWDHDPIPKAHGGPDAHWNLTPRPTAEHRKKTAKRDVPMIAKVKRIAKVWQIPASRTVPDGVDVVVTTTLFKKPKRKIRNRGFSKQKRRFGQ